MTTDLIKRFISTPIETTFELNGGSIRLQTNCQAVADHLRRALPPRTASALDAPELVLRVVAESDEEPEFEAAPTVHRLGHNGLSFVSLGHKSFLACDRRARHGISFISESLVRDEKIFGQFFVPALLSLLSELIEAPS